MGEHDAAPVAAPTQVQYPWRATSRTGVQAAISTLTGALLHALGVPTEVIAVQLPAVAALLALVMAVPAVDALLTRWGLGAGKAVG